MDINPRIKTINSNPIILYANVQKSLVILHNFNKKNIY